MLRNLPRIRLRKIRQHNHSQLIVYVAQNMRLESLP